MERPDLAGDDPQAAAQPGETEGEDVRGAPPRFHLITQDGPTALPVYRAFATKEDLVGGLRAYYVSTFSGDKGVSQSVWMFEGDRVRLCGDPLRQIVFAGGDVFPLVDNDPAAADDSKLVPPSVRARNLPKRPA